MADFLFEADRSRLVPSELTRGGWSDQAQHGSPPSGILARAIEQVPTAVPMHVTRFTVDLFRAVPLRPLSVETKVLRQGKRIQVVEALLWDGDVEIGRASALKIRIADLADSDEVVGNAGAEVFGPGPEDMDTLAWDDAYGIDKTVVRFHTDAVEIRSVDASFVRPTRGRTWFRLRFPLVAGEEMTPFQRLATMADLANGNSQALDPRTWLFVNPDITLYVHRPPEGEWLAMDSVAYQQPSGIGVTDTLVYDRHHPVGRILQAQLIDRRRADGEVDDGP